MQYQGSYPHTFYMPEELLLYKTLETVQYARCLPAHLSLGTLPNFCIIPNLLSMFFTVL